MPPEGAPLGALCVIDKVARPGGLTDMQRNGLRVLAKAVMRRLEARRFELATAARETASALAMREVADLLPAIIWSASGDGQFDYFNSRWTEITGNELPKTADDWRAVVHLDESEMAFGKWAECFRDGKPFESEYRLKQADGSWRWTLSRALPLKGADGNVVRWYGTLTDVDSAYRLSENRDLLAREFEVEAVDAAQHAQHEHVLAAPGVGHQCAALALQRHLDDLVAAIDQRLQGVVVGGDDLRVLVLAPDAFQHDRRAGLELAGAHPAEFKNRKCGHRGVL